MSSNPETSARRMEKGHQASLTDIVQTALLPTPLTSDANTPITHTQPDWERVQLRDIGALLPTPLTRPSKNGQIWVRPEDEFQNLENAIAHMPSVNALLPTPTVIDSKGPVAMQRNKMDKLRDVTWLLPTPTVMDMGSNYTPEEWEAWKLKQKVAHNNGNGHEASLTQEALLLLPTPKATNNENQQNLNQYGPNLGMALMPEQYQWTGENTRQQLFDGSES